MGCPELDMTSYFRLISPVKTASRRFRRPFPTPKTACTRQPPDVGFGLRFYNPLIARWISRDPIEEQGGLNLYLMCLNDTMNKWDKLGLLNPGFGTGVGNTDDPFWPYGSSFSATDMIEEFKRLYYDLKAALENARDTGAKEYERLRKEYICCRNGKKVEMNQVYTPNIPQIGNQVEHCFVGVAIRKAELASLAMMLGNLGHEILELTEDGRPDDIYDCMDIILDVTSVSGGYYNRYDYEDCITNKYCKKIK